MHRGRSVRTALAPTASAAARPDRAGSNSHPSRTTPTSRSSRRTWTLVTPSLASSEISFSLTANTPSASSTIAPSSPHSAPSQLRRSPWTTLGGVAPSDHRGAPSRSSAATFAASSARFRPRPCGARLRRAAPRFPGHEELLRDLGVARAFGDEPRDRVLALGQSSCSRAAPPGRTPSARSRF